MSNKTQLQTNNTKLDELTSLAATMKDKAAALPEAGGGSVVETCTVEISSSLVPNNVLYEPNLGQYVKWEPEMPGDTPAPFQCVCGTFICVKTATADINLNLDGASVARTINNNAMYDHIILITASAGETAKIY